MTNGTRADLRELFHKGQLTIGISELSRMTGVSPRQLRYWQKKGYIIPKNEDEPGQARVYTMKMVIKAAAMSNLLQTGYTFRWMSGCDQPKQSIICLPIVTKDMKWRIMVRFLSTWGHLILSLTRNYLSNSWGIKLSLN